MEFQASYRGTARWIVVIPKGVPDIGFNQNDMVFTLLCAGGNAHIHWRIAPPEPSKNSDQRGRRRFGSGFCAGQKIILCHETDQPAGGIYR
jgi:hypothetical protein